MKYFFDTMCFYAILSRVTCSSQIPVRYLCMFWHYQTLTILFLFFITKIIFFEI